MYRDDSDEDYRSTDIDVEDDIDVDANKQLTY